MSPNFFRICVVHHHKEPPSPSSSREWIARCLDAFPVMRRDSYGGSTLIVFDFFPVASGGTREEAVEKLHLAISRHLDALRKEDITLEWEVSSR